MDDERKLQEIVLSSGTAFHARVAHWLKINGWTVLVSPYYMDHGTGKSREIDLIAEKVCYTRESYRHKTVIVVIRLYIECKFVAVPTVFWFADRDQRLVEEMVCSTGPFEMDNSRTSEHHYLAGTKSVAKLFASSPAKEPDNEPFYKALNQVLNARVSMKPMNNFVHGLPERSTCLLRQLEFPVVVIDSTKKLRKADFFGGTTLEPIPQNFQLEVRYAYTQPNGTSRSEFLLLDLVEFSGLDNFIKSLERDAEIAGLLV